MQDKIWLNIDKPLKTQVLHFQDACPDVERRGVGIYKPVNDPEGRDGWWQSFADVSSAHQSASTRPAFNPIVCCSTCIRRSSTFKTIVEQSGLFARPPQFYWVNQGVSYKEEREQGIIWAPQLDARGRPLPHWELVTKVAPGDIVFSYAEQRIEAVGTVLAGGRRVDSKPIKSATWSDGPGYQADLAYTTPEKPKTKTQLQELGFFKQALGSHLLQSDGKVKLVYLMSLTPAEGRFLLNALGFSAGPTAGSIDPRVAPPETVRRQLVDARLGQGKFRDDLLAAWQGRCPLTQIAHPRLLRASHIKRWADCTNAERIDPNNGILLAAHIDAAFDCGLISFADDGKLLVAQDKLTSTDRELLQLAAMKPLAVTQAHRPYLLAHRQKYGFAV